MTRKIVVVGWGLAAHRLVTRLLSADADADLAVTVYAAEGATAHDRDALPDALAAATSPEGLAAETARAAQAALSALPVPVDPRLQVRAGVRATAVDRLHRVVHSTDHVVQPYDTLVLATGTNPVLPPIRGLRTADGQRLLPGVLPAHSAADFRALAQAAATASRAVVIGGGTGGLRVAAALHALRADDPDRPPLHVELVDQTPAAPEITPADAYFALRRAGVVAYQDCRVRSLDEGPDGRLAAVTLADGYRLTTDLAVLSCGTAPNVALAWTAGLAVARGIVVDDTLRSVSDPAVYALGACAEHRRTVAGPSAVVLDQADVLADRLSGRAPLRTYRGAAAARLAPGVSAVVAEAERVLKAAAA
ncbi:FAD-dependent oxidoreductase [Catenulispora subtropica]|uniref:FAD-dependent oxidoreductase n=1 Tax=Catenulispora subtropica TaxID=450798 RepID=A0ABN2RUJ0_9ACTN